MPLSDVLATGLLGSRHSRSTLEPSLPELNSPGSTMEQIRSCCMRALQSCSAHSAGISIFNHPTYDELAWLVVVGEGEGFQGRRYPLRHSMCGVCFDEGVPQLFIEAQSYFQWLGLAGIRVAEGLVYPLRTPEGNFYGTIWVVTHRPAGKFNKADVTALSEIADALYPLVSQETVGFPSLFPTSTSSPRHIHGERRVPKKR